VRSPAFPYLADWFVISLRWLATFGLVISLALNGQLLQPANLLLLALALWNLLLTVLTGLGQRFSYHRPLGVGVDFLIALALFWFHKGMAGPVFWAGLLPVLSAAIYFDPSKTVLISALMALAQGGLTYLALPAYSPLLLAGTGMLLVLSGLLFGVLGQRLVGQIRSLRQTALEIQEAQQRLDNERLRAIYTLTSTLTATLNYERVIDSALDISLTALAPDPESGVDDRLVSAVLLFSKGEVLEIAASRGLPPTDLRVVMPAAEGAVAQVVSEGEPLLINDPVNDPELGRLVALHACRQAYLFPLRSGVNAYGLLVFAHPEPGYFTPDRLEVLGIIGHQTVVALQNARLYQELADERDRIIEVQEEARKKLARDLHDGPTQSVSAIAMRVNLARRLLQSNPLAASEELGKIEELARRTTQEIRHMLFTLRPLVLESQGLVAALQAMATKMKETYNQNVTIEVDESILTNMELGKQNVIFYIAEEAVNNARKHAQAENIWVRLRPVLSEIALLEIQDNGVGFDVEAVMKAYDKRGSLGMVNLQERTELVNGVLEIKSAPGKGTRVQVFIPLTEAAAERLHHAAARRG